MKINLDNDWMWTPYNKEVDEAMDLLKEFDYCSGYQSEVNKVFNYIYKLEDIIEDHGLQQEVLKAMKGG